MNFCLFVDQINRIGNDYLSVHVNSPMLIIIGIFKILNKQSLKATRDWGNVNKTLRKNTLNSLPSPVLTNRVPPSEFPNLLLY